MKEDIISEFKFPTLYIFKNNELKRISRILRIIFNFTRDGSTMRTWRPCC
jgi:hypothetical protein